MIHGGMTNNEKDYEICMRAENIHLPASGHFGMSAATGGLADDHDVSFKYICYICLIQNHGRCDCIITLLFLM